MTPTRRLLHMGYQTRIGYAERAIAGALAERIETKHRTEQE